MWFSIAQLYSARGMSIEVQKMHFDSVQFQRDHPNETFELLCDVNFSAVENNRSYPCCDSWRVVWINGNWSNWHSYHVLRSRNAKGYFNIGQVDIILFFSFHKVCWCRIGIYQLDIRSGFRVAIGLCPLPFVQ